MIITDRSHGPAYSCDQSAKALHTTLARPSIRFVADDDTSYPTPNDRTTRTFDFESLYPELVPVPETADVRVRFLSSISHLYAVLFHHQVRAKG